jgi:lactate racemase
MNEKSGIKLFKIGDKNADLSLAELREFVEKSLSEFDFGKRVLAVIPDQTRDDNTPFLFPAAAEILAQKGVEKFDALVAQGTHAPMTEAEKLKKIGADLSVLPEIFGTVFDHEWDNPNELSQIGEISAEKVGELTGGIFSESISVTLNRLISPEFYDCILVFSSTVPHEVAGFSGGAKYFFPGVSGRELTNATHWLGALSQIENIIGRIETPPRRLIDAAAEFVQVPVVCFNSVVTRTEENHLRNHALLIGDIKQGFRAAAEISREVHIKYVPKKYCCVIALLDEHYDEMWVGGKASYKLGGIIEAGGELIIFAPHLKNVSITHGAKIEKYGYAPIETVQKMVAENAELREDLCVAAHLAHVAYAGRINESGEIIPRFSTKLATDLNAETCRKLNFEFMDWREFDLRIYENDADTLIVKNAGRDLYLVG